MIKKILTLCIILTIASVAQTYDIYDVNGKWYAKINGQINKSVIEKYKQNVGGSVLVWKQSGKKKKNIDESNAPLRIIDLKQDSFLYNFDPHPPFQMHLHQKHLWYMMLEK
jgi:hypothetical protein